MGQAELLIAGLLVAVAGLSALARMLAIPYPIVLVIASRSEEHTSELQSR